MKARLVVNLVAFEVGWFACVLGGAYELPVLALGTVAGVVAVHVWLQGWSRAELVLLAGAGVIGTIADTLQMHGGVLIFPGRGDAWLVPVWFTALWVNFGTLLNEALRFMKTRLWAAALFGLLGGPAAYYAGVRLGALELHPNLPVALAAIGVEWMLVMPVLMVLATSICRSEPDAGETAPAAEPALGPAEETP